jgi:DNA mismatch repair protein MutS2
LEKLWEKEELRKIFQEEIITLRNERYVVAVKAEFKNLLPGIIHDQSQSRATFFIEPLHPERTTAQHTSRMRRRAADPSRSAARVGRSREISGPKVLGHLDLVFANNGGACGARSLLNEEGRWYSDARTLLGPKAVPIDSLNRDDPGHLG